MFHFCTPRKVKGFLTFYWGILMEQWKCYSIGDLQKQITELKSQVQKLEQDNARQEGQVIYLEFTLKIIVCMKQPCSVMYFTSANKNQLNMLKR